jgi:hypothetical protein
VLFASDFEADDADLEASPGIWEWGEIVEGAPVGDHGNVWATNLSGNYGECDDDYLTSPDFDLGPCSGATVTLGFDLWYEYEGGYWDWDGLIVEFQYAGEWHQVEPVGGWDVDSISAYMYCDETDTPYVNEKPGWTGESGEWTTQLFMFDLPGSEELGSLLFRFVHGTDGGGQYAGAYIDNLALTIN